MAYYDKDSNVIEDATSGKLPVMQRRFVSNTLKTTAKQQKSFEPVSCKIGTKSRMSVEELLLLSTQRCLTCEEED